MKRTYRKGMGRGYRGPLRPRFKKPVKAEPVLIIPEPPTPTMTAREKKQEARITREIERERRRWDAMDRIHGKRGG